MLGILLGIMSNITTVAMSDATPEFDSMYCCYWGFVAIGCFSSSIIMPYLFLACSQNMNSIWVLLVACD